MTDIGAQLREARRSGRTALEESAAKQILAAYGIAVPRSMTIETPDDAAKPFAELSPPLVAKLVSRHAIHKSDLGGVKIGLETESAVRAACREIAAAAAKQSVAVEGFLVEEMAPPGTEVVIGGMIDPTFGPVIMFTSPGNRFAPGDAVNVLIHPDHCVVVRAT